MVKMSDVNMASSSAVLPTVQVSSTPNLPDQFVIPPPQTRIIKEGWLLKRGMPLADRVYSKQAATTPTNFVLPHEQSPL